MSTIMEDHGDETKMRFSRGIDRIVEEFNAEHLHQVLRDLNVS